MDLSEESLQNLQVIIDRLKYLNELKKLMDKDTPVTKEVVGEKLYEWTIENWNSLTEKKEYSPEFEIGGYKWRILLFPKGKTKKEFLSVFLENLDVKEKGVDERFHVYAKFVLAIRNYNDYSCFSPKSSNYRFNKKDSEWGFNRFIKKSNLYNQNNNYTKPLIENGKTVFTAYVRVFKDESQIQNSDIPKNITKNVEKEKTEQEKVEQENTKQEKAEQQEKEITMLKEI